jgi:hypothetical protein
VERAEETIAHAYICAGKVAVLWFTFGWVSFGVPEFGVLVWWCIDDCDMVN